MITELDMRCKNEISVGMGVHVCVESPEGWYPGCMFVRRSRVWPLGYVWRWIEATVTLQTQCWVGDSVQVMLHPDARNTAWVSFDGRHQQELHVGDRYHNHGITSAHHSITFNNRSICCIHFLFGKNQSYLHYHMQVLCILIDVVSIVIDWFPQQNSFSKHV